MNSKSAFGNGAIPNLYLAFKGILSYNKSRKRNQLSQK